MGKYKPRKPKNLRGWVSGRLVATALTEDRTGNNYHWRCRCVCGGAVVLRATHLIRRLTKSCGCLVREKASARNHKHGLGRTPEAAIWRQMIARCHNPKTKTYPRYGGRGIWVCERWKTSFLAFLEDMGKHPDGLHLDRENNSLGYCCGKCDDCRSRNIPKCNCRWVTVKVNQRNRTDNRLITALGKTQPMTAWAEETGIRVGTLWQRLQLGWSDHDVVTKPVRKKKAAAKDNPAGEVA